MTKYPVLQQDPPSGKGTWFSHGPADLRDRSRAVARKNPDVRHSQIQQSGRHGRIRLLAILMLLVGVLAFGPLLSTAQAQFVTSSTIPTDGTFTGWTATGVFSQLDESGDDSQIDRSIHQFWSAIATQNGGTEAPSTTNQIQYYFYRIDHKGTAGNSSANWNIQLRLESTTPAGQVDHILRFTQQSDTKKGEPDVKVALLAYDTPVDNTAFTTGAVTVVAANYNYSGTVTADPNVKAAEGIWGQISGTNRYGTEVAIPASWFSTHGNINPDGSGVNTMIGAVFSSTGQFDAVGTVKDELNDANGNIYEFLTSVSTGETTFETANADHLAFGQHPTTTAAGGTISPAITVRVEDASNVLIGDATHEITLSIATDPSGGTATLSGTLTRNAVNGVATFDDISIDVAGAGYTLQASETHFGLTAATSNSFDITADNTNPTASISDPTNGALVTSQNTITGSASDNNQVASVSLTIQRSSDSNYWNGTGWQAGQTTVAATASDGTFDSGSENWTYNSSSITGNDTYTVTATATDGAGNTGSSAAVSYTIDGTAPTISTVTLGNDGSGNLSFSFQSDEQLGTGAADIAVSVDGPTTANVYTFSRTDFSETGTGPYTYFLTTTQAYGDGDGTYAAAVDDARDPAGNDGADGTTTATYTYDSTAPASVSVDAPTTLTYRASSAVNGGNTTLNISYSYTEANPNQATITLDDGAGNTATYTIDDSGYAGDNSTKTVTLDLTSSGSTTGTGLTDGITYSITVQASDDAGHNASATQSSVLAIDNTAPIVSSATVDGTTLGLTYNEALDTGSVPATGSFTVRVNGSSVSVSGVSISGQEVTLTLASSVSNGDAVEIDYTTPGTTPTQDLAGNNATSFSGQSVTNNTADTTPPVVSSVSLTNNGANNLVFSFQTDEQLGGAAGDLAVSMDGPTTANVYNFSRTDFSETGTGPYTYTLTTTQAYNDGNGTYTAAVDDARDAAGNDGADGSQTDTHAFTPPAISNVILGASGGNLTLSFTSDQLLGTAGGDLAVSVDGPVTNNVYTFNRNDFSVSGTGPYTYTLTATQAYNDGDGTYTAAVDDARDPDANDGADGSDTGVYTFDGTSPVISSVTLANDGSNNLVFSFQSSEALGSATADLAVSVDGPATPNVYSFNRPDFSVSGSGPFTYTLTTTQAYGDGTGTYTAAVDDARDAAGNDGADGSQTDTHAFTPPAISNVSLGASGGNLTLSFTSDQLLGTAAGDLAVTVDGPVTNNVYTFGRNDFSVSGTGPYTYTLTATQAYNDGDGTYTAAVDDAHDVDGNDGADGTDTDTHTYDGSAPTISNVTLTNNRSNNLVFSFQSDEQLGSAASDLSVTVDGPSTVAVYTFDRTDFTETGSGPYTYSLATTQAYGDGTGTYTAKVVDALDLVGNDGADGTQLDTHAFTPPVISSVTLGESGGNVTLTFQSDQPLGSAAADVAVSVDGPTTNNVYTFDRTDFTETGTGPYTYTLTTTQAYGDGNGTYTAAVDDAVDPDGNDGGDGTDTGTYYFDGSIPGSLSIDAPTTLTYRASSAVNGGLTNLDVSYRYTDDRPSQTTITLDDGAGNTATYTIDDSGYPGDNSSKTVTLDLTNPGSTTGSGLVDGTTYDLTVRATDGSGNDASASRTDILAIDNSVPTLSSAAVTGTTLKLIYSETLDTGSVPATGSFTVRVNGSPVSISGVSISGQEVTLTLASSVSNGDAVEIDYTAPGTSPTQDLAGNDAANLTGQSVTNNTADATAPVVSNVSLSNDGSNNLVFSFQTDEQLGGSTADLAVSIDGPTTANVYTFDRTDFSETGTGPYTYSLTTTQAYGDGTGTYTAAVDDARDVAGNDGADGSQTDIHDFSPPAISGLSLGESAGNITLSFTSDQQLGSGTSDLAVSVDGPNTNNVYTFDRSDFSVSGSGPYTYTLTTAQAYNDGDGVFTVAVDDAVDADGNDGGDGTATDTYTFDGTAPTSLSLDAPLSLTYRASSTANSGTTTLEVQYSYTDANPDETVLTLEDGSGNTASFTIDDTGYAGDNSTRTATLDLTSPGSTAGGGLTAGTTYDIRLVAKDAFGKNTSVTGTDRVQIDNTRPALSAATVDGTALKLTYGETLDAGAFPTTAAYTVRVNGTPVTVSGISVSGQQVSLTLASAVSNGDAVEIDYSPPGTNPVQDRAGNDAAGLTGQAVTNHTGDSTPPTISNVSLTNDGSNTLVFSFQSSEQLAGAPSDIAVSVDGPATNNVYTFDRTDFSESGSGPYTYTLSTSQTYADGTGTYTAAVEDALDAAGNDGADGSQTDTHPFNPPTVSSVSLGISGGNLTLTFTSDRPLGTGTADLAVSVDGPNTANMYAFDRTDFSETGTGPYTYSLTTTQAYDDGTGTYTASIDDAIDTDGNDGADGSDTDSHTTGDATAPGNLSLDSPTTLTYRASSAANGGNTQLSVGYSYTEANPDAVTITLDAGAGNTATFTVDDSGYAGDNSTKTATLDLASPGSTTGNGLVDGTTYDITVQATDASGNSQSTTGSDLVRIDNAAPVLSSATVTGSRLVLTYAEPLNDGSVPATGTYAVRVNGGSVSISEITVSGRQVVITLAAAVGNGDAVEIDYSVPGSNPVEDRGGNDAVALSGRTATNHTGDSTAPVITDLTLTNDRSNSLVLTFVSDESLGGAPGDILVTVDGPVSGADVYRFDADDFIVSGTGPYTYTLETTQAYGDGTGTYTAAVDDALDAAGNDGADGSLIDSHVFVLPTITDLALGESGGTLTLRFTSDRQLGSSVGDLAISVRGPSTSGIYAFDRTDFAETGTGPYVYTLDHGPAFNDGDGTYTAIVNDAVDTIGNDGADGTTTDTYSYDGTGPAGLTLDSPSALTYRASSVANGGRTELAVGYSYTEANPDQMTVTLADGAGNSATFSVDDSGYAGDNTTKTVAVDLTTPASTTGSGLVDGTTYDITLEVADAASNSASTTGTDLVAIDNTRPALVQATVDGATVTLGYDEVLNIGIVPAATAYAVHLNGSPVVVTAVSVAGQEVRLTLGTPASTGDALGADYTVPGTDPLQDSAGNQAIGFADQTVTNGSGDIQAPTISDLSLTNDGSNQLVFSFVSDEQLGTETAAVRVTVNGPTSGTDVYTFDRTEFSEVAHTDGTFTYMLTTGQSYADGTGTYTAAVDDAMDAAGNDGADGSLTDTHSFVPPVLSGLILGENIGNLTLQFTSDKQLGSAAADVDVRVEGPATGEVYTFDRADFSETGTGPYTYSLTTVQAYDGGEGTYLATVDDAVDVDGNDGADGTLTDSYPYASIGTPSLSTSTISVAPDTVTADGQSTAVVTVQLKDETGRNLESSGGTIQLAPSVGSLSPVTDNGDGTYTAIFTAPTTIGEAVITGTLDGQPLADSARVVLGAGPVVQIAKIGGDNQRGPTMGMLKDSLVVKLSDARGNPVAGAPVEYRVIGQPEGAAGMSFVPSTVTSRPDGHAAARFRLGSLPGDYTAQVRVPGADPTVTFSARARDSRPLPTLLDTVNTVVFNGDPATYMYAEPSASLNDLRSMTVEIWVKPTSLRPSYTLIDRQTPDPANRQFRIGGEGNTVRATISAGADNQVTLEANNFFEEVRAGGQLVPSIIAFRNQGEVRGPARSGRSLAAQSANVPQVSYRWTHLALTVDASTGQTRLYRNGYLLDEVRFTGNLNATTARTQLGSGLDGEIHEVRIWNTVREPRQIQSWMTQKLRGDESNLVLYHTFDDKDPGSAADLTGNRNHFVFSSGVQRRFSVRGVPDVEMREGEEYVMAFQALDEGDQRLTASITELAKNGTLYQVENDGRDVGPAITSVPTALTDPENRALYRPHTDYAGVDSLGYALEDSLGNRAGAFRRITIVPVNDGPRVDFRGQRRLSFNQRDTLRVDLDPFVTHVDDDFSQLEVSAQVMQGNESASSERLMAAINQAQRQLVLTTTPLFTAESVPVVVQAEDPSGAAGRDTAFVTVHRVNAAPAAFRQLAPADQDTVRMKEDGSVTFRWEPAHDLEGEAMKYIFDLRDGFGLVNRIGGIADTTVTLSGRYPVLKMNTDYRWRVYATDGQDTTASVAERRFYLAPALPDEFRAYAPYPNPTPGTVKIPVDIPARTEVTVQVYNAIGQKVRETDGRTLGPGAGQTLTLDLRNLGSGVHVYLLRVRVGKEEQLWSGKVTLIK